MSTTNPEDRNRTWTCDECNEPSTTITGRHPDDPSVRVIKCANCNAIVDYLGSDGRYF